MGQQVDAGSAVLPYAGFPAGIHRGCPTSTRSVGKTVTGTASPAWRSFLGSAVGRETAFPAGFPGC